MFSIVYLGNYVVMIGIRPLNTFVMHQHLAKKYRYKYQHLLNADYSYLKPFFKKFYHEFQPEVLRPFHGMNPKLQENI